MTGSGPMVEIFDDRMEITNPGTPLMEPQRMLDHPPRSRTESLASLMRLIGVCEERSSGVDKVVSQTELYQLPAPAFEVVGDSMRTTLFAPRALARMDRDDRIRAVYLHACSRRSLLPEWCGWRTSRPRPRCAPAATYRTGLDLFDGYLIGGLLERRETGKPLV